MLRTLKAVLERVTGNHRSGPMPTAWTGPDEAAAADIIFNSIDPVPSNGHEAERLLCPVTRQELAPPGPIYRCRICCTAFSQEGWEFLTRVDKGRCCACGSRGTVQCLK